ncbi:tRNA pseudouridine synthase A [Candidatus Koribacter versatilis Ellin345]|uniref:tRNA pseudouridine synthase A n=1 Tax=Koribacter versatilis (strain Ellin345) TaxID=204669 RepID=Q1IRQ4_KORVE|nr:tRNA pseudouridine(38-40) synthase TruA [Candidatus Koribacter versatilis]ABF40446.1 tRNA pseudouridine synthase A [Candidatus Koribacter versatilis Ellin345]
MPRNFKITLAYDGHEFHGWQIQPGKPTIQGTLAETIERITGEQTLPQGSGRTDAGVHALGQVASVALQTPIPADGLHIALNDKLPPSIRALTVGEAAPDFHARHSAKGKTYRYRIYRAAICSPFLAHYVWHYPWRLDESVMQSATAFIQGEHDFTSFAASDPDRAQRIRDAEDEDGPSNVRTIYDAVWRTEGHELIFEVRGNGFLHHMVRNLVGTFVDFGKWQHPAESMAKILREKSRSAAGPAAPASGLYLVNVEY